MPNEVKCNKAKECKDDECRHRKPHLKSNKKSLYARAYGTCDMPCSQHEKSVCRPVKKKRIVVINEN